MILKEPERGKGYFYVLIFNHFQAIAVVYDVIAGGLSNTPTNLCMALYCIHFT